MVNFLIKKIPSSLFSVPITMDVINLNYKDLTNELLKQLLYNFGPIYVTVETKYLKFYPQWPDTEMNDITTENTIIPFSMTANGILGMEKPIEKPDLAVLLVGYGKKKDGKEEYPYWILKNSWSKKWGYNGYFSIYFYPDKKGGPRALFKDISYISKDNLKYIQIDFSNFKKYGEDPNIYEEDLKDKFLSDAKNVYRVEEKRYGKGYKKKTKEFRSSLNELQTQIEKDLVKIPKKFKKFMSFAHKDHNRFGLAISGPVFYQGLCGSDWAFAGCQMLASSLSISMLLDKKVGEKLYVSLSPQYIIQRICFLEPRYFAFDSNPCSGGNINLFNWAVNGRSPDFDFDRHSFGSIISMKEDPYRIKGGGEKCNTCECPLLKNYPISKKSVPEGKKGELLDFQKPILPKTHKKKHKKEKSNTSNIKEKFSYPKSLSSIDKVIICIICFLSLLIIFLK